MRHRQDVHVPSPPPTRHGQHSGRPLDIVVFGATGMVGAWCCKLLHEAQAQPGSAVRSQLLKDGEPPPSWGVAGRPSAKLRAAKEEYGVPCFEVSPRAHAHTHTQCTPAPSTFARVSALLALCTGHCVWHRCQRATPPPSTPSQRRPPSSSPSPARTAVRRRAPSRRRARGRAARCTSTSQAGPPGPHTVHFTHAVYTPCALPHRIAPLPTLCAACVWYTGDYTFIADLVSAHHDECRRHGSTLISACGPQEVALVDVGALLASRQLRPGPHTRCTPTPCTFHAVLC